MSRARGGGVTFEDVRQMMLALPGVEERSSYGTPGFHVAKKFMSRLREDDVLVLKPVEDIEQEFLMSTDPDAFFTTDHYRGYPTILIRLSKVDAAQVGELIEQSWRRLAPRKLLDAYDAKSQTAGTIDRRHRR
jgi:hypothetical protein